MDNAVRPTRLVSLLAVAFGFVLLLPTQARAQQETITACYVPDVGAVYLIGEQGLSSDCLEDSHVKVSWSEGVGVTDHGELDGLDDNDHPQYVREGESAGGDLSGNYPDPAVVGLQGNAVGDVDPSDGEFLGWSGSADEWVPMSAPSGGDGTTDHGQLSGLTDDDHNQYLLAEGVRQVTDGFAVSGEIGSGSIPVEGTGTRLMWYPGKAAFRAGQVGLGGAPGDSWDDSNVGENSVALGANNEASGQFSIALGSFNTATMGDAVVIGNGSEATAYGAFAMGTAAVAEHQTSFVWSDGTSAFHSTDSDQFLVFATGGVGIGTNAPETQLDVRRRGTGVAIRDHVAHVKNESGSDETSALAVQIDNPDPDRNNNFITFFADGSAVGAIQGDGRGGVSFQSGNADFAEMLQRRRPSESIEAGEVVGLYDGAVTKETAGAEQISVVTDRAIVVGNDPGGEASADYEQVAFVGQVPVKTRGPVEKGDLLVVSGEDDGTASAVAPSEYAPETDGPVVGQAWESSSGGTERVNALIGSAAETAALRSVVQRQRDRIQQQEDRLDRLEATVERLVNSQGAEEEDTDGGSR